jgi:hypothetical protein
VWCDQFGAPKHKAMMISILQIGSPLGVVIGYYLTVVVNSLNRKVK